MDELDLLGQLQTVDLALDELRLKLIDSGEKTELEKLEKELTQTQNVLEKIEEDLAKQETKQKKLEGETELLEQKIKREEKRLFNGTIANPKELTGIQAETKMLAKQKDERETELLEQLEAVDALSKQSDKLSSRIEKLSTQVAEARNKYERLIEESEDKIQRLKAQRKEFELKVSAELYSEYQKLRAENLRQVVVPLVDETCQGCFVTLPAEEVDRMLRQDKLWHCPYCRRMLMIKR